MKKLLSLDMENEIPNLMDDAIKKISDEINRKKEVVIKERLEILGLSHLFPTKKLRFPKITCEIYPHEENWYADNGTEQGVRIVSFKNSAPNYDFSGNKASLTANLTYD